MLGKSTEDKNMVVDKIKKIINTSNSRSHNNIEKEFEYEPKNDLK